jgi:hypothetical protein
VAAFSTTIEFVAVDECALLLSGGIDAALGLSADGAAELLNVCKLALHCIQAVGLALHGFLHGGMCGTEVCKWVTLQRKRCVVVHSGHTVSMLQGWDSRLVNECNLASPIFLGGVDHLDDWWDRVFAWDQIFYPLVHIPQHLMMCRPMSMTLQLSIG